MSGYVSLVVLLLLWVISFFALRAYIKKRSARETLLAGLTDEVRGLEAELNRIADRDASLLEERIAELHELLKTADEKTAAFKALIDEIAAKQNTLKAAEETAEQARKELEEAQKAYGEKPLSAKIDELQKRGFSIDQIARKLEKTVTEIELSIAVRE